MHRQRLPVLVLLSMLAWATLPGAARAAPARAELKPCWLKGVEHVAQCGVVQRPLDPADPLGKRIDVHFAILPALARNKRPDPVFFFAGGPGQSAISLAGPVSRRFARFLNRRDVVLIDQRGTGRSAPLQCEEELPTQPLRELADPEHQARMLDRCRLALQKLPHGDLRQYTTTIAMADADAVRAALGVERVNLIGGSYGTRAALEYLRQFPMSVRRTVIDGVAPPDMVLPAAFSPDAQAAFDAMLAACEADAACKARYPQLRVQWAAVLGSVPRQVTVRHPVTGLDESFMLTRDMVTGLVRLPLYVPTLASALPYAVAEAASDRFTPLLGLASAMGGGQDSEMRMAMGMHFSVVCAEDMPRIAATKDKPGADFGSGFANLYSRACAGWPRGLVPQAFYEVPATATPVLVLSGGIDPVTPPRHGARVAQALGVLARHVVVPRAGHGVMALACMRDAIFNFVDAQTEAEAAKVDADCARAIPRPRAFAPVRAASAADGGTEVPR